mmetsp:Transcript_19134/g.63245  ORF Transcript_19134/g.63245 Transcript_19134/m.63245 type:complete len:213 (-) Transcript_19134:833-1471(-)
MWSMHRGGQADRRRARTQLHTSQLAGHITCRNSPIGMSGPESGRVLRSVSQAEPSGTPASKNAAKMPAQPPQGTRSPFISSSHHGVSPPIGCLQSIAGVGREQHPLLVRDRDANERVSLVSVRVVLRQRAHHLCIVVREAAVLVHLGARHDAHPAIVRPGRPQMRPTHRSFDVASSMFCWRGQAAECLQQARARASCLRDGQRRAGTPTSSR